MTRFKTPLFALLALIAVAGALSGCNTTAGAGADVSATGHAVTHAADAVKEKL
jgi:predicted small secreted protein